MDGFFLDAYILNPIKQVGYAALPYVAVASVGVALAQLVRIFRGRKRITF